MVSGSEATTGNETDALESAESNTPPIYQALLDEMDTGTREAVAAAVSAQQPGESPTADPQHRSGVNARAGQGSGGARAQRPT